MSTIMSDNDGFPDTVRRDGFTSDHGIFRTEVGNLIAVAPGQFKKLFLPRTTSAGKKALENPDFVRAQLTHYGVEFEESDISGNGLELLKTFMKAGMLNKIPAHILQLQADMHQEWINTCTIEQLGTEPRWLLERYFLSNGVPDHTKTRTLLAVPFPKSSRRLPRLLEEAAGNVSGLHAMQSSGFVTRTVFIAWDETVVKVAVQKHYHEEYVAHRNEHELPNLAPNRDKEQQKAHRDYLDSIGLKTNGFTPVGSYVVRIELIEAVVKYQEEQFIIDIYETNTSGLYQADFDFQMFKGIMMMSSDERALEEFEDQISPGHSSVDEQGTTIPANELEESSTWGAKKKPPAEGVQQGQKQTMATKQLHLRYLFKHRCYESFKERLFFIPRPGIIQFDDERFLTFTGQMVPHFSVKEIIFTGYKMSDKPPPTMNDWDDFEGEEGEREPPSSHRKIFSKMGYE
ncbi:uncharacterized protein N7483_002922 [Penicillium malachiteum]|uniref:uncharacterized protein n=1 Tax=Penicillium malachiteum TaxID=1324776 RepID=UPI002549A1A2|nr:uncharacterized protein N7483_002922 [Penicillium malachiteum]KAJ5737797.1 hypothetical protein N7483_002922 [Penicillium malachiteum]